MTSPATIGLTRVGFFALVVVAAMSFARAETAPGCPESGMPIETLGSEKA